MNSMFLQPWLGPVCPWLYVESAWWTYIGLFGNALFTSRFLIQWIKSERHGKIIIPPIFWHLSFWGSLISLIYALHVDKLPVILSFVFLPIMYGRNLRLLKKTAPSPPSGGG
ncbi:MAG: lipid-A-disaccharide synthase N-terminal domain-containing protein [Lentisphaerae bacterium]|nr:lipid-A-disaccharide synthase N-terminal domain-containing protein [Lentisphaerota bacterium]